MMLQSPVSHYSIEESELFTIKPFVRTAIAAVTSSYILLMIDKMMYTWLESVCVKANGRGDVSSRW